MGVLIDASVLIGWERAGVDVDARVRGREDEGLFLSVITVSELLHGVHRAEERAQRARRSAFVEAVIDAFPLLPIDLPTARLHAELWAGLAATGSMIGAHDLWLGAAAVAHDLTLATVNVREFRRVPGLEVEDWGQPA
ncbi:MAG: type II toxin-antitoxin system VapC family toxin [Gemmatimonadota bacterium]